MKLRKNKKGQAILEFLVVTIVIITLIFMLIQLSFGMAWGHYVQYVTYMASRAFLAAAPIRQDQDFAARDVLEGMLKARDGSGRELLPFVAQARTANERDTQGTELVPGAYIGTHPYSIGKEDTRTFGWAQGVQYNFQVPLFLLPVASWITKSSSSNIRMGSGQAESPPEVWRGKIRFTSDSWLGREVSIRECEDDLRELSSGGIGRSDGKYFLFDNGC